MTEFHICELVKILQESEGTHAISSRSKAHLVVKGIKMLLPKYEPGIEPEHTAMQYLIGQAEKYLKNPETQEIIAKANLAYDKVA